MEYNGYSSWKIKRRKKLDSMYSNERTKINALMSVVTRMSPCDDVSLLAWMNTLWKSIVAYCKLFVLCVDVSLRKSCVYVIYRPMTLIVGSLLSDRLCPGSRRWLNVIQRVRHECMPETLTRVSAWRHRLVVLSVDSCEIPVFDEQWQEVVSEKRG